ncbi:energy-coupling factor ABC transporter permease [Neisseria sp.]|uniref:energy-coupling factor ABC transporter permease n=1 Tax=Neisseria sp. TaxID=192066 RepID=UPI0026DD8834|nr:energy-coupling factor ABC transporter permease [Neisseria sp.]MDO4906961.1 energy-coupling factor ABC transporter permease [Neisseria sp.]
MLRKQMYFLAEWFPPSLLFTALLLWAAVLLAAAKPAFAALNRRSGAVVAAAAYLAVLWGLNAGLGGGQLAGMSYHLLGINLLTLMFGLPAALWLGTLLLVPYLGLHGADNLYAAGLNALFVLLPAATVNFLFRRLSSGLPDNLFIYIFLNGFLAAAAGMLLTGLSVVALLQFAGVFAAETLWQSAFPVFFLLAWGEAFLSGILTAVFVALRPQWLATFDDTRFLRAENSIWK